MKPFGMFEEDEEELVPEISPLVAELEAQRAPVTNVPDDMTNNLVDSEMSQADEINTEMEGLVDSQQDEAGGLTPMSADYLNTQEAPKAPSRLEQLKALTQNYESKKPKSNLADLQKAALENDQRLNWFRLGDKIATAYGNRHGGKGQGFQDLYDNLSKQGRQPIEDAAVLQKDEATEMTLGNEREMNDPESDISKFMRQQALAFARRPGSGFDEASVAALEKMTANQLQKLGFKAAGTELKGRPRVFDKNILNPVTKVVETVLVDEQGNLIKNLGETGYSFGSNIDPITGLTQMYSKSNLNAPTVTKGPQTVISNLAPGEAPPKDLPEYNSPTILARIAPKLKDKFDDQQKAFLKDVTDSREVATSTTNLSNKLKPGANNEVDSGLLGGIQTQAAKMAGQKGVLTDQDLVKFAGAGGVLAKINRIIDGTIFGDMTDEDIQFFKMFAKKMDQSLAEDINNRSQFFVENIHNEAKDYLPGLSTDNVRKWLNVDSVAPSVQKKASPKGASGLTPEQRKKQIEDNKKKLDEINKKLGAQ